MLPEAGRLEATTLPQWVHGCGRTTGTVTATWTGAGGTWNLGAVTHTGPSGLITTTLVDVENRP